MNASEDRTIGLIAGGGQFPLVFARAAREEGFSVIAVGIEGDTDPRIAPEVTHYATICLGQLGKLIECFKRHGVRRVALAGSVDKRRIFSRLKLDWRAVRFAIKTRKNRGDDLLLRALAEELASEGIVVEPSTLFLPSLLAPEGVLTSRRPSRREHDDILFGWNVAKAIGSLDVGQCVVVKHRVVLALEGIDGTDATIARGGALCGKGAVVVKVSKPSQDLRFDVPAVGRHTIEVMKAAGATTLAIEAGRTLLFDRCEMIEAANRAGITVVALNNHGEVKRSAPGLSLHPTVLPRGSLTEGNVQALADDPASQEPPATTSFRERPIVDTRLGVRPPVRVGVIGAGHMGTYHAEKLASLPSACLVGVADVMEERARTLASRLEVGCFPSHRHLIGEIEAAVVAVPTAQHFPVVRDLLERGIHVFVEKPLAASLEEAETLVAMARGRGCLLQVGHIERFNPAFTAILPHITYPLLIEARRLSCFSHRCTDVDVVMDLMIHDLDLVLTLVPSPVRNVEVTGTAIFTSSADVASARLVFENGVVAQLTAHRAAHTPQRVMEIFEEGRSIIADYGNRRAYLVEKTIGEGQERVSRRELPVAMLDPMERELRQFLDSVRSGTPPLVDGVAAMGATTLAFQISQSLTSSTSLTRPRQERGVNVR